MSVTKNNKMLAQDVRSLTLTQIARALNGDDEPFRKQLLLKLAGSILPRLNEHTGEDGGAIIIMPSELINKNDTPRNSENSSQGSTQV